MKRLAVFLLSLLLLMNAAMAESAAASLQEMYAQAELMMIQGDYAGAAAQFERLSAYSDAAQMTLYCKAVYAADMGLYTLAVDALNSMGQFKDAPQLARYYTACSYLEYAKSGSKSNLVNYETYRDLWSESIADMFGSSEYDHMAEELKYCRWARAIFLELALYKDCLMKAGECDALIEKINEMNAAAREAAIEKMYQEALGKENAGAYQEAAELYRSLGGYRDSESRYAACMNAIEEQRRNEKYQTGLALMEKEQYIDAREIFLGISSYRDSAELARMCSSLHCSKAEELLSQGKAYEALTMYAYRDEFSWSLGFQQKISAFAGRRMSGGMDHTVGVAPDGSVVLKGFGKQGISDVKQWRNIVAVAAANHSTVGLKENGAVAAAGGNRYGQCDVAGWTDIVSVAMGLQHTVGLKADGTVVATGYNDYGGCDVQAWKDIVAISAGSTHTLGLKADGSVVAAGVNGIGQCSVEAWHDMAAVAAGSGFSVGLKSDGSVVATGRNKEGQCDVEQWSDIISIAVCGYCTFGLKSDGSVVAAGDNMFGIFDSVAEWHDIAAISAGTQHVIGMKTDGTLVGAGKNDWSQSELQELNLLNGHSR